MSQLLDYPRLSYENTSLCQPLALPLKKISAHRQLLYPCIKIRKNSELISLSFRAYQPWVLLSVHSFHEIMDIVVMVCAYAIIIWWKKEYSYLILVFIQVMGRKGVLPTISIAVIKPQNHKKLVEEKVCLAYNSIPKSFIKG